MASAGLTRWSLARRSLSLITIRNSGTVEEEDEEDWRIVEEAGEEDLATVREEGDLMTVEKLDLRGGADLIKTSGRTPA